MRKFISIFIFVIAISFIASAKQVTESEALMKADKFSQVLSSKQLSAIGSINAKTLKKAHVAKESVNAFYYVFNRGANNGYIIVSGDDQTEEILGYSDSGSFDYSNLPENMKWWLSTYEDQIKALLDGRISIAKKNTKNATASPTNSSVAPLLKTIAWNQDAPYNNLCPVMKNGERTVTGCVATAMAQIMYYHNWPEKGIGSVSYTTETNKFNLSVDFSKTTYQWSKMTPTYNSSSTDEANSAVATLMYHCGTASLMDYGDSSGASQTNATNAFIDNFNYDKGIRYLYRDYYPREKWEEMLKTELDNNRPIMYGGYNSGSGHQFVCDGYDANNMFHINWGWGGVSNGYFKIAALDPSSQGIGGSSSGYNSDQNMVFKIQKPTSEPEIIEYEIFSKGIISTNYSSATLGEKVSFTVSELWNMGYGTFDGKFGVGLYNSDTNELETVVESARTISLPGPSGWPVYNNLSVVLPESLKASRYKIKM
ncbi:MAG: C10 family peptidase, partial [Muribaculaceae bacterium]